MEKKCDACEFLKNPQLETQILTTGHRSVAIGNNHAYLGRAFVTLREHKGSLGELCEEQWSEFHEIVRTLEKAYKEVFGAEPLNWGCFMNHAFRTEPFNPHVHWHIFPRYHKAPIVEGITFDDPLFGNFYDETLSEIVSNEVVSVIAERLRQYISP